MSLMCELARFVVAHRANQSGPLIARNLSLDAPAPRPLA